MKKRKPTAVGFDLMNVVHSAQTLQERMTSPRRDLSSPLTASDKEVLFRPWREAVSIDDGDKFLERRILWSGLNDEEAARILSDSAEQSVAAPSVEDRAKMPRWADTLGAIMAETERQFRSGARSNMRKIEAEKPSLFEESEPLPFEELLAPAVCFASRSLLADLKRDHASPRLAPSAYRDLRRHLLSQLTEIAEKALFAEFDQTRPYGKRFILRAGAGRSSPPQRQDYNSFVRRHGEVGLRDLLVKYPVLGRLLATRVELWIEMTTELIVRLETDWDALGEFFAPEQATSGSRAVRTETGLSDYHHGGRSVLALVFADGSRLIYKPRDLRLHRAFDGFLAWYNSGAAHDLRCPRALVRDGYGWVEYVEPRPLTDQDCAHQFYHRAGELLCVLYVLGGTDCHYENLIAQGGELLLIDTETLLHADLADDQVEDGSDTIDMTRKVWGSVLQTGLLPCWEFSVDRSVAVDLSGLGSESIPQALLRKRTWNAPNTDDMHRHIAPCEPPKRDNVPVLDGKRVDPSRYLDDLIDGFASAYRNLLERKMDLLGTGSPLDEFRGLMTRFVFRPTKVYTAILMQCLKPEQLRSGIAWGLELELLARAFVVTAERPKWWSLLDAEWADMLRLDVPYFTARTDARSLELPGNRQLSNVLEGASLSTARTRVQNMSIDDLAFQIEIIRGAYAARASAMAQRPSKRNDADGETTAPPLTEEICLELADTLAKVLAQKILRDSDGGLQWLGFSYVPEAQRLQLDLVPQGLYDGRCGIALFLAALDHVQGGDQYYHLWTQALDPFRKLREDGSNERDSFARSGLGLANGFGSVVYAFVRLWELAPPSAQSWLMEVAATAAGFVTEELAERDEILDLLGGGAGAIVGLLALYGTTHDEAMLERAAWCGHRIARQYRDRILDVGRSRRRLLTGFSHGASGIAFALMKLFHQTGEPCFERTARMALEYEAALYDPNEANWPDFRVAESQPVFQSSWCHGAPGIGLARLGILTAEDDPGVESEWAAAIETTRVADILPVDNLCCGNLGVCDILLTSALGRNRPDLHASALKRASQVVHRAGKTGSFLLFAGVKESVFNPGFFQGTAGIGYELLRLARPTVLPSVLLFQTGSEIR